MQDVNDRRFVSTLARSFVIADKSNAYKLSLYRMKESDVEFLLDNPNLCKRHGSDVHDKSRNFHPQIYRRLVADKFKYDNYCGWF
jgi:hypothetical protein